MTTTPHFAGAALRPLAAAFLLMIGLGVFHAWSLFVTALETRLDLSRAAVSGVYAVAVGAFTVSMLLAPSLYRRASPAAIATGAGLLAAAGLWIASTGPAWALWLGYAGLFGVANGLGYSVALQTVQLSLPQRRGLATSLAVTAYAVGPAAFAPLLELSIRRLGVFETFALIAAGVAVIGALQVVLLAGFHFPDEDDLGPRHEPGSVYNRTFWVLWVGFFLSAAAGLAALAHAAAIVDSVGGGAARRRSAPGSSPSATHSAAWSAARSPTPSRSARCSSPPARSVPAHCFSAPGSPTQVDSATRAAG